MGCHPHAWTCGCRGSHTQAQQMGPDAYSWQGGPSPLQTACLHKQTFFGARGICIEIVHVTWHAANWMAHLRSGQHAALLVHLLLFVPSLCDPSANTLLGQLSDSGEAEGV